MKSRVLVIDDEMSGPAPGKFLCAVRDKLNHCLEAAGCVAVWPKSAEEAERAEKPDLIVLDIDLSHWREGLTGDEFLLGPLEKAFGVRPVVVLTKEPKSVKGQSPVIRKLVQRYQLVWKDKSRFLAEDEVFWTNRMRSLASDIGNTDFEAVLNTHQRQLWLRKDGEDVCLYEFDEGNRDSALLGLIEAILQRKNKGAFFAPGSPGTATDRNKWIKVFNDKILDGSQGKVGYKLLVSRGKNLWGLAVGGWGPLEQKKEKREVKESVEKTVKELAGRVDKLEQRLKRLEGR